MLTLHTDTVITFSISGTPISALNMVYEKFLRTIPNHSHGTGSYEIHYISEGYGHAHINGTTYNVTPHTLYVTGPHINHAQTPDYKNPMCEYCIYLKIGKKKRHTHTQALDDEEKILSIFESTPFWFGEASSTICNLIESLFEEAQNHSIGYEMLMRSLLKQLIVNIVRNYKFHDSNIQKKYLISQMDKTSVIIEEYFLYQYQNLSLKELSDKLSLSTRQTERLLQTHYGKTFLQKKKEARMSVASILLDDTNKTISTIASDLGYSCIEHFTTAFKNYYGLSPRQYRQKYAYHHLKEHEV